MSFFFSYPQDFKEKRKFLGCMSLFLMDGGGLHSHYKNREVCVQHITAASSWHTAH